MTGMAVRAGGRRVPDHLLGALRRTVAAHADPPLLRRRLEEDGYLYLPAVLDGKRVLAARREVFGRLAEVGEIRRPAADGIATGTSRRAELIDDPGAFLRSVCEGAAIMAVTHGAPLHQIMTAALDAPARAFDFLWLRTMAVGRASPLRPCLHEPRIAAGAVGLDAARRGAARRRSADDRRGIAPLG